MQGTTAAKTNGAQAASASTNASPFAESIDGVPIAHRRVNVGEVTLHVVESGPKDGPLVVLLHGFPEFWWTWRHQIPALVRAGYRVVAPDMRGYNESEAPRAVSDYRMEKLTGDVAGLIRAMGRERAAIVGHDWGGIVAWGFAMQHPAMLERLVIMNAPHPKVMLKKLRTREQQKKSWYVFFFQLPFVPERMLARDDFAFLRRTFAKDGMKKEEIQSYVDAAKKSRVYGMLNYYRASLRGAFTRGGRERPTRIDAPVLVVWGERDAYLGSDLAEPPRDLVPDLRLERIADATHWVNRDAAPRVNALLAEFLEPLRRA